MQTELWAETAEDTKAVGEAVAGLLRQGDAVALTGELGAGKTTFVQGVARALGFEGHVVSPTFTLVREYEGRLRIFHVDVYRLERIQEVLDLGLDEMATEGLLLVEWGDAVGGLLPSDHLTIEFTVPGTGDMRKLVLTGEGPSWGARWGQLKRLTEPWERAA
jgi:tRNA threonylcarbamoyladenosine biosynthesis protein TsaE